MANKLYSILYYVFIAAVVAVGGLVALSAFSVGGLRLFVVQSGSMEPAIKTGSVVLVRPATSYRPGEVITFGPYSKTKPPTTHRIADVRMDLGQPVYITKGDANKGEDTREVRQRDVIGQVLIDVPYVGYAVAAAKQPIGFALLVIVPALVIIADEGRKVVREIRKRREARRLLDAGVQDKPMA